MGLGTSVCLCGGPMTTPELALRKLPVFSKFDHDQNLMCTAMATISTSIYVKKSCNITAEEGTLVPPPMVAIVRTLLCTSNVSRLKAALHWLLDVANLVNQRSITSNIASSSHHEILNECQLTQAWTRNFTTRNPWDLLLCQSVLTLQLYRVMQGTPDHLCAPSFQGSSCTGNAVDISCDTM